MGSINYYKLYLFYEQDDSTNLIKVLNDLSDEKQQASKDIKKYFLKTF